MFNFMTSLGRLGNGERGIKRAGAGKKGNVALFPRFLACEQALFWALARERRSHENDRRSRERVDAPVASPLAFAVPPLARKTPKESRFAGQPFSCNFSILGRSLRPGESR